MVNVLFVCTGNSARSQMAEALLGHLGDGRFHAASAGSHPASRVSRHAVEVLRQHGIEWKDREPRAVEGLEREPWDIVITVCDHAREHCPVFPYATVVAHWGQPDPALVTASDDARRRAFEQAFDTVRRRVEQLVALPADRMPAAELRAALDAIGAGS